MTTKICIKCERTSNEIPLIHFEYKEQAYTICPQCLPVLIHKTHELSGKLPGIENIPPAEHSH
jgi:hypothetical protein